MVRLWSLKTGNKTRDLIGHTQKVSSVAFSPDGQHVLSGSYDHTARLWRVEDGKEVWRFECDKPCGKVAVSPDGKSIVMSGDHVLRLVGIEAKVEIWRNDKVTASMSAAFSLDGRLVVTGENNGWIHVWDAKTGKEKRRIRSHTDRVNSIRFLPDGRHFISGSEDKTLRIWEHETGREVAHVVTDRCVPSRVAISPNGRYAISGGGHVNLGKDQYGTEGDFDIRLWRLPESVWPDESATTASNDAEVSETLELPHRTKWESFPSGAFTLEKAAELPPTSDSFVGGLEYSPSGTHLLCGWAFSNRLQFWNLATNVRKRFSDDQIHTLCVAISPDGKLLATGGNQHKPGPYIWDLRTLRLLKSFEGHSDQVHAVEFSRDGTQILTGSWDKTARIWDASSGEELRRFDLDAQCNAATFSGDGSSVFTAALGIEKYDIESEKLVWRVRPSGNVYCISLSSSGQLLASGSQHALQFWNAETGEEIRRVDGHSGRILSVKFLPDGRHIISGSEDKTLRIWNFSTGEEVARLDASEDIFTAVAVSPDGQHVATGASVYEKKPVADNSIRIWQLPESVWPGESASAEKDAFAVLSSDRAETAKFDTLADAVTGSTPGDTIEIRGNGPFVTGRLEITHPLVIRAAEGFRPVIQCDANLGFEHPDLYWIVHSAPLVLEGIELRCRVARKVSDLMLLRSESTLMMTNCRLFLEKSDGHVVWSNGDGRIQNCMIVHSNGGSAFSWTDFKTVAQGNFAIRNNIHLGRTTRTDFYSDPESLSIEDSTMVGWKRSTMAFWMNEGLEELTRRKAEDSSHLSVSSCIVDCSQCSPFELWFVGPDAVIGSDHERASQLAPRLLSLKDVQNVWPQGTPLLTLAFTDGTRNLRYAPDMQSWQKFWKAEKGNSSQGVISFGGGKVYAKWQTDPASLKPDDFRLTTDSAGYQAGPDGEDFGANVDLVGPGEAYERWKKKTEYQQWQKESRELIESATSVQEVIDSDAEEETTENSSAPRIKDSQKPVKKRDDEQTEPSNS